MRHLICRFGKGVILLALLVGAAAGAAEGDLRLSLDARPAGLRLSWPATVHSNQTALRPYFEVQRSLDWRAWTPIGERQRPASTNPLERLSLDLAPDAPQAFYRLLAAHPQAATGLAENSAEVFGYGAAFAREMERLGPISPGEFAAQFPHGANYLPALSWQPTNALFWEQFDAPTNYKDFTLQPEELAVFQTNGFVVSERLGGNSFAGVFYDLWHSDLPVFISTDAVLQAWHRTYDAMLEELEETYQFDSLGGMLDNMAAAVGQTATGLVDPTLSLSLQDADFLLTVARSLLFGTNVPSALGQDGLVNDTLADIRAESLKTVPDFMGFCRTIDYSQFKVRGHYTHSQRLGRYFKAMMWLGRVDLPVAGTFDRCGLAARPASPRELGTVVVLWHLLKASDQFERWADMDRIISVFVGWADSLTFGQLNGLLAGAGIRTLAGVTGLSTLEWIQESLVQGQLGVQDIRSDWFDLTHGSDGRYALPRTFTVFGQRLVPDSWAFSQTVFDSVDYQRRVPGALDMAFSVLRNDQVVPELVQQMDGTFVDPDRPHAAAFRDGFPHQQNLAAVRRVLDGQPSEIWERNLYQQWLATLRELSAPTTAPTFPEAMRRRAWAMKTLNTQLASWTHLRHDTILYAKQSYTGSFQCIYPKGFVEPRLAFWRSLRAMAERAANLIAALTYVENYPGELCWPEIIDPATGHVLVPAGCSNPVPASIIQQRQGQHLTNFAAVIARLETLVSKELAQEPFNREDELFINGLMENRGGIGCVGTETFSGWYPALFYRAIHWREQQFHKFFGAGALDAVVADVHTDAPAPLAGDPGSVLHQAVGRVNLLVMAVEHGGERFICAGPVLSHYEFEVLGEPRRLNDDEWQRMHVDSDYPADVPPSRVEGLTPPTWTQSYLVRP